MQCRNPSNVTPKGSVGTIKVPCGVCIQCRINKTMEWATRCLYENEDHEVSCFITLTYDDDHIPENGSLDYKAVADFWKRVRKHYYGNKKGALKYYLCGEYGPTTFRPHYHAAVFDVAFNPEEWIVFKEDSDGPHYTSPLLLKLWPFGFNEIGLITPTRLNYVCGYIQKKQLGASRVFYSHEGLAEPDQRYSKNLGVNALLRDSDRLTKLFLQKKGKALPKYYAHKLALNEIVDDDGYQLLSLYAYENGLEVREKFSELSDSEYYELMRSKREQTSLDIESRMNMFNVRGSI